MENYRLQNGLPVSLRIGSITEEYTQVIVNVIGFTAKTASHGVLSRDIFSRAGSRVEAQFEKWNATGINAGDVVETFGGKLHCMKIYHCILQAWSVGEELCKTILRKAITGCLTKAHRDGISSISFPTMGTGGLKVPPKNSVILMFEEFEAFAKQQPKTKLERINIVLHEGNYEVNQVFQSYITLKPEVVVQQGCLFRPELAAAHKLPPTWTTMTPDVNLMLVILIESDNEYQNVSRMMRTDIPHCTVKKIQRIQNVKSHAIYMTLMTQMEKSGELQLWHGTNKEAIESINLQGFDRQRCRRPDTLYGNGTYFAKSAAYSSTFADPDTKGLCYMYLCKVLAGWYTLGKKGMLKPPPRNPGDPKAKQKLYDSLVDDEKNPTKFVIFQDNQAYPEYLVTFTKK